MPSADVTLSPSGRGGVFADSTQRKATLRTPGGNVSNVGAVDGSVKDDLFINVDGGDVSVTDPLPDSVIPVPYGATVPLPATCRSFTFKCASTKSTYFSFQGRP